ncbi:MAG: SoxR reducing system RseC family protein [Prevotellaceae bacterium]|jgi:hypothetical protein|nr:SoxR reducing system RseC family protein [Prevotellaceae bacterium]
METVKKTSFFADVEYVDDGGEGVIVGWENSPKKPDGTRMHLIAVFPGEDAAGNRKSPPYALGDKARMEKTVTGETSFTLAYLLPLVVLVGSLLLLFSVGAPPGVAGVSSLAMLAAYTLVVRCFLERRRKLGRWPDRKVVYTLTYPPPCKAARRPASSR